MKKLLRVLVLVLTSLLTLPWQLTFLAIMLVSEGSHEKTKAQEMKDLVCAAICAAMIWIQTGKLFQTEEESE